MSMLSVHSAYWQGNHFNVCPTKCRNNTSFDACKVAVWDIGRNYILCIPILNILFHSLLVGTRTFIQDLWYTKPMERNNHFSKDLVLQFTFRGILNIFRYSLINILGIMYNAFLKSNQVMTRYFLLVIISFRISWSIYQSSPLPLVSLWHTFLIESAGTVK